MKHLYFSRHGQTEMNVSGHISGHVDPFLTAKGREQAKLAGKKARDAGLVFDVILASPLTRAHETAKLIAKEVGYPAGRILVHDFLKERHFGEIDGKRFKDLKIEDYYTNPFAIDHLNDVEKVADMQERAQKALEFIKALEAENILVVSHGAFGRALRRAAENKTIHDPVESFDNAVIHKLI